LTVARQPRSILILGGGAFTLPQYLSEKLPDSHIDVVEIDPKLQDISIDYFGYKNPANVTEIFTDARAFVNQSQKRYEMIIVDVYGDTSIPFSFITKEYGQALKKLLAPDGVVVVNIIGGMTGACFDAFAAVDAGYRSSLPYVLYSNESDQAERRANHIVVYGTQPLDIKGLKPLASFKKHAYTDNYAPAERLYYDCQQEDAA
jgi:predicted membrane-bound spermidine synthase